MATPKSRPRLEGACYRITQHAAHSYFTCLPHTSLTHIAHTYQFPSSLWASALDCYMVSALGSRVGWTLAHKERRNERMTPILYMVTLVHKSTPSRQHPNQFSCFYTAHPRDQHTDRQTDTQTTLHATSVATNHILCSLLCAQE